MKRICVLFLLATLVGSVSASWYWPFGSDDEEVKVPRLSELMEPASVLIDEASDLAEDGQATEAVAKYRAALVELDRIEAENRERAKSPEFATLRNKRAYVNAAIDSLLMGQVRSNAKVVSVTDTTELEKKLAKERSESRRETAMRLIEQGDFIASDRVIGEILSENPTSAMALNLKAALETRRGRFAEAQAALNKAIETNGRSYFAYYNMAELVLMMNAEDKAKARYYYETGRTYGGPVDLKLEALFR